MYRDRVDFYCIYIEEAHPEDGWQVSPNHDDNVVFNQPTTAEERAEVAEVCMLKLALEMPTLLDDMDNTTEEAYAALPERLYVVSTDGRVTFRGKPGPFGFDVEAWENAIKAVC